MSRADRLLVAVDVGNSTVAVGVFAGDRLVASWRLAARPGRSADEYAAYLRALVDGAGLDAGAVAAIGVSSVVPALVATWREVGEAVFGRRPYVCQADGPVPIAARVDMLVGDLGSDRLCDALAARTLYGAPVVVVDCGSATTMSVVGPDGAFVGGAIAPGLRTAADALAAQAALLPGTDLLAPAAAIGRTSVEAVRSGLVFGAAGLVDGLVRAARRELGAPQAPSVLTGGLAPVIAPHMRTAPVPVLDPCLTLVGVRLATLAAPA